MDEVFSLLESAIFGSKSNAAEHRFQLLVTLKECVTRCQTAASISQTAVTDHAHTLILHLCNCLSFGLRMTPPGSPAVFWSVVVSLSRSCPPMLESVHTISHLNNVKTPAGKVVSWLRLIASRKQLLPSLNSLAQHEQLIYRHYDDWALMRDREGVQAMLQIILPIHEISIPLNFDDSLLDSIFDRPPPPPSVPPSHLHQQQQQQQQQQQAPSVSTAQTSSPGREFAPSASQSTPLPPPPPPPLVALPPVAAITESVSSVSSKIGDSALKLLFGLNQKLSGNPGSTSASSSSSSSSASASSSVSTSASVPVGETKPADKGRLPLFSFSNAFTAKAKGIFKGKSDNNTQEKSNLPPPAPTDTLKTEITSESAPIAIPSSRTSARSTPSSPQSPVQLINRSHPQSPVVSPPPSTKSSPGQSSGQLAGSPIIAPPPPPLPAVAAPPPPPRFLSRIPQMHYFQKRGSDSDVSVASSNNNATKETRSSVGPVSSQRPPGWSADLYPLAIAVPSAPVPVPRKTPKKPRIENDIGLVPSKPVLPTPPPVDGPPAVQVEELATIAGVNKQLLVPPETPQASSPVASLLVVEEEDGVIMTTVGLEKWLSEGQEKKNEGAWTQQGYQSPSLTPSEPSTQTQTQTQTDTTGIEAGTNTEAPTSECVISAVESMESSDVHEYRPSLECSPFPLLQAPPSSPNLQPLTPTPYVKSKFASSPPQSVSSSSPPSEMFSMLLTPKPHAHLLASHDDATVGSTVAGNGHSRNSSGQLSGHRDFSPVRSSGSADDPDNEDGQSETTEVRSDDGFGESKTESLEGFHIKLILTVPKTVSTEVALEQQQGKCMDCGTKLKLGFFFKPRLCEYTGGLFCTDCHQNDLRFVPAKILSSWDFHPYPVSVQARVYLDSIYDLPVVNPSSLNPILYREHKNLEHVRRLRRQLRYIREFITTCKQRDRFADVLKSIRCPLDIDSRVAPAEIEFFSIHDLVDVGVTDQLRVTLVKAVTRLTQHITKECDLCGSKAFFCEICKSQEPIFAFQLQVTRRCVKCKSLFHRECLKKIAGCPKCARLEKRKAGTPVTGTTSALTASRKKGHNETI